MDSRERRRYEPPKRSAGTVEALRSELRIDLVSPASLPSQNRPIEMYPSQKKFQSFLGDMKRKLEKDIRERKDNRSATQTTGSKSTTVTRTSLHKEKNSNIYSMAGMDDLAGELKNLKMKHEELKGKYDDKKKEVFKLHQAIKIRQETFLRREQRAKRREKELMKKLFEATTFKHGGSGSSEVDHQMDLLRERKFVIKKEIEKLKEQKKRLVDEKKAEIQARIEDVRAEFSKQIDEERKRSYSEEKHFIEQSRNFKKCLAEFRKRAEDLDERNMKLQEDNLKLRIAYKAQQENDTKWAKINARYRKDNEKLRNLLKENSGRFQEKLYEIESLKMEIMKLKRRVKQLSVTGSRPVTLSRNSSKLGSPHGNNGGLRALEPQDEDDTDEDYQSIVAIEKTHLERMKKQSDQHRRQFKILKKSYIHVLSERTELELFLKQCIEDVRATLRKFQSGGIGKANQYGLNRRGDNMMVEFEERDRDRVLRMLLSKEKVLNLLYENSFPSSFGSVNSQLGSAATKKNNSNFSFGSLSVKKGNTTM